MNETIAERIKKIRTSEGLTQQKFADRLGIKQNTVAQYEMGRNAPIDAVVTLICREFHINERWLRTGEGEMKKTRSRELEIAAFMGAAMQDENDDFVRRLVAVLSRLDVAEWELLEKMAHKLAAESAPARPHVLKIAGRDGSYQEHALTDDEKEAFMKQLDSLPDASDDL